MRNSTIGQTNVRPVSSCPQFRAHVVPGPDKLSPGPDPGARAGEQESRGAMWGEKKTWPQHALMHNDQTTPMLSSASIDINTPCADCRCLLEHGSLLASPLRIDSPARNPNPQPCMTLLISSVDMEHVPRRLPRRQHHAERYMATSYQTFLHDSLSHVQNTT